MSLWFSWVCQTSGTYHIPQWFKHPVHSLFPIKPGFKIHIFPHVKLTWKPHLSPRKTVIFPHFPHVKGLFFAHELQRCLQDLTPRAAPWCSDCWDKCHKKRSHRWGYVLLRSFTQFFRCFSHQFHELYPVFFEFLLTYTFHEIPSFFELYKL